MNRTNIHKHRHRERLFTPRRAAYILGVSTETLRRWDISGKIYCVRTAGGHRRIPESEIDFIIGLTREDFRELPKQPSKVKSPIMRVLDYLKK